MSQWTNVMRFTKLKQTEQIPIYALIFLALGLLLYRFLIYPELERIDKAKAQLNFWQDMLETEARESQHRNVLNVSIERFETELTAARQRLFSRDEAIDFLSSLPDLMSRTGNILTTMISHNEINISSDQNSNSAEQYFSQMPVQIAIRGYYSEIIQFFEQLQSKGQLVTVSSLKMETADNPREVDADFTLNIYIYEDEKI